MKILQINSVCGVGSTGRIASEIARVANVRGHKGYIAYGRNKASNTDQKYTYRIGNNIDVYCHALAERFSDGMGLYSRKATERFVTWIENLKPDIIHLHNIHGYYINIEVLFSFLAAYEHPVVWTLHDCWPITGHCAHFDYIGCEKWKNGCMKCSNRGEYPKSYVDRSKRNYLLKERLFTLPKKMVIVTPSQWLNRIVRQSYLNRYEIRTIHNGIDPNVFRPRNNSIKEFYGIENKVLVLGVANIWSERKGMDTLMRLAHDLGDQYCIMIVGDIKKTRLTDGIIHIKHTESIDALAEIYSAADVFVNATLEDNFPTVNIEALACGLPVITYDTGGCGEAIDNASGILIAKNDYSSLLKAISSGDFMKLSKGNCVSKAKQFLGYKKYNEYIDLYESIV